MSVIINESLLDKGLESMEKARTWPPRIISKLEALIRTEEDFLLFKINPLQFAEEKNFSEQDAINLFLYATKVGLFEIFSFPPSRWECILRCFMVAR
jgi:hypothetical protein